MHNGRAATAAIVLGCLTAATGAKAADRVRLEGAFLSLVSEAPDEDGRFRAALAIDLEPGWKTYWLDPGEAGFPPRLDAAGSAGIGRVDALFPAPHRVDDAFAKSIVYSAPFAVALTGETAGLASRSRMVVEVTLGLCREICVPVRAVLDTVPAAAARAEPVVASAFVALPRPSEGGRGILSSKASPDGRALDVTVASQDAGTGADIFVDGGKGWSFGAPLSLETRNGETILRLPVSTRPRKATALPPLVHAVLAGAGGAWRADALAVAPGTADEAAPGAISSSSAPNGPKGTGDP